MHLFMILVLLSLAIPPPIALSPSSGMVNVGEEVNVTCLSVGDFSGSVVWSTAGESVSGIGLCLVISFLAISECS